MLLVCLNISGMMQVRSAMREREPSIRSAIMSRRLIHSLASDHPAGPGELGSIVLFSIPPVVPMARPPPAVSTAGAEIDPAMVAICVGLCLVTSLVFGLPPAARFSRPGIIFPERRCRRRRRRAGRVHRTWPLCRSRLPCR